MRAIAAILAGFCAVNIALAKESAETSPMDIAKDAGKAALYSAGTAGAIYWTGVTLRPGSLDRGLLKDIVKNERLATEMDVQAARARARRDVLLLNRSPRQSADKLAGALIMSDLETTNALAQKSAALAAVKKARAVRSMLPYGRGALAALPGFATVVNATAAVGTYGDLGKDVIQYFARPKNDEAGRKRVEQEIGRLHREVDAMAPSSADSNGSAAEAVVAP